MGLTKKVVQETAEAVQEGVVQKAAKRMEWRNIDFDSRAKATKLFNASDARGGNLKDAVKDSIKRGASEESDTVKKAYGMLNEMNNEGMRFTDDLSSADDVLKNGTKKDGIGLWGMIKKHPYVAGGIALGGVYGVSEMTDDDPDY